MLWLALSCARPAGDSGSDTLLAATADAGPDLAVGVGEPLTLDGSASVGVGFAWDFGDGGTADAAVADHVWDAPGNYVVVLRVTGEDGGARSDSARVTAFLPPTEVAPIASGMLALDAERGALWAVTPEADAVARVALDAGGVPSDSAFYRACRGAMAVVVVGDEVAVSCDEPGGDAALLFFDAVDGAPLGEVALPFGSHPRGVVGRSGVWWVALQATGEVAVVQGGTAARVSVAPDVSALLLDADGGLHAARFRSPDEGAVIARLDAAGGLLDPLEVAADDGAESGGTDSDTSSRGVPSLVSALALSPDGGSLLVPSMAANIFRGGWRDGYPLTFETTARAAVAVIEPASGALLDDKQFDDQDRAEVAVFSPLGERVYVAHPGTATVHILDRYTLDIVGSVHDAGAGLRGLAISPDGGVLYALAWLDREVRAYDVAALGAVPTLLGAAPTVSEEPLDAEILLGKRIFHDSSDLRMAKDGYLTCASCHPDGDHDGRTWDFTDRGEGLRNTITLLGRGGVAMGPLHWTANFDEVQDFENDIRGAFGGQGFLDDADWEETKDTLGPAKAGRSAELDALAAYVGSLDRAPASPWEGSDDGAALFEALDCASCHPPPLYTDSSLDEGLRHDVGTIAEASGGRLGGELDGFDTPTLLGVFATGPYLHDGSAATVEDAIAGHTAVAGIDALGTEERAALSDFVRGL